MRSRCYLSDLSDAQWALVAQHIPPAKSGGCQRAPYVRAVFDAIIYLLRTGCQWRQLPSDFPGLGRPCRGTSGTGVWLASGCCCIAHGILWLAWRLVGSLTPHSLSRMDGQTYG
jgi:transposase